MEDNILGVAISYLEERGIDTKNMSVEEILLKYNEMLMEEEKGMSDKEDDMTVSDEDDKIDDMDDMENDNGVDIEAFIKENAEVIQSLNEEQRAVFDKLIEMLG